MQLLRRISAIWPISTPGAGAHRLIDSSSRTKDPKIEKKLSKFVNCCRPFPSKTGKKKKYNNYCVAIVRNDYILILLVK
jgi:hypothetical protein